LVHLFGGRDLLQSEKIDPNTTPRVSWEIDNGARHVFVHISAVERAGLSTLNEGQQIEYEMEENRGKTSAVNLKVT
jgi:cold shock CspA family protein